MCIMTNEYLEFVYNNISTIYGEDNVRKYGDKLIINRHDNTVIVKCGHFNTYQLLTLPKVKSIINEFKNEDAICIYDVNTHFARNGGTIQLHNNGIYYTTPHNNMNTRFNTLISLIEKVLHYHK